MLEVLAALPRAHLIKSGFYTDRAAPLHQPQDGFVAAHREKSGPLFCTPPVGWHFALQRARPLKTAGWVQITNANNLARPSFIGIAIG